MTKYIVLLISINFIVAGCAKYSKEEIASARYKVQASQNRVDQLRGQLRKNNAYSDGACFLPQHSDQPKAYVKNMKEAEEYATAYCYSSVKCDLASLSLDVDTFTERFIASESCGRITDRLRADGLITNSTEINLFEATVDSSCENEVGGFLGLLGKLACVPSVAFKVAKIDQLKDCLRATPGRLLDRSREWENAPRLELEVCSELEQELQSAQDVLDADAERYHLMIER